MLLTSPYQELFNDPFVFVLGTLLFAYRGAAVVPPPGPQACESVCLICICMYSA